MLKLQSTLVQDTWVKAGHPGPRQTLTGVDILHGHVAVPAFFVYPQGLDAERALQGLRDTLSHYPLICGRLVKDERGQVICDGSDAGVQWRVLRCKGPTPVGEHRPPLGDIKAFYTSFMPWQVVGRDTPTLQVSIHQFDDGGATLTVRIVHSQFDGSSLFGFMKDWSRACLGQPIVGQTFDRDQMIRIGASTPLPARPLAMISRPPLTQFMSVMARLGWRALVDIRKEVFRLPASAFKTWQAQASTQRPDEHAPNAARLATAYVMKALDPHLPQGQDRDLGMVLDMRYVKGLGLSKDYFGNALCYPEARLSEAAARDSSLIELARLLKPDAEQLTAAYLSQAISVLEHARLKNDVPRLLLGPAAHNLGASIFQNNCSLLPVYEFDFGTGCAGWYDTIPMTIRMMTLTPTPTKDGGLDIHLCGSAVERNALRARLLADGIAPHPSQMSLAA